MGIACAEGAAPEEDEDVSCVSTRGSTVITAAGQAVDGEERCFFSGVSCCPEEEDVVSAKSAAVGGGEYPVGGSVISPTSVNRPLKLLPRRYG